MSEKTEQVMAAARALDLASKNAQAAMIAVAEADDALSTSQVALAWARQKVSEAERALRAATVGAASE